MKNQRKAGAILSYLSIAINTIIQLVYTPFLVRFLGQSEYGLYSLVSSIIGYLTILDLGFGNAIIVYTAKYRAKNNTEAEHKLHGMFKVIFYIIALIAMLLGLILFFGVDFIFGGSMTPDEIGKAKVMMLILIFNLGATFAFNIYSSIIAAYEEFVFQKMIAIIGTILRPLIMLPLLLLGFKSITMVCVLTGINMFILLSNYFYCRRKLGVKPKFNGFDKKLFSIILSYSIWVFLTAIVDKVNWSVDNFILGAVSGTIAVSIYSVASQINAVFVNLSTALSGVFLPKMSKIVANNADRQLLTNEFIKVGRIQFYLLFLVLSGFILFGKQFIHLWVGDGYETSYYVTLCLIAPAIFSLIQNLGLSIMQAMNKFRFKAISTFIMSIFNIGISLILASKYGPVGAAIGTTIAIVTTNIIAMNIYYYKVIKIDVLAFWKSILSIVIRQAPVIAITAAILICTSPDNKTSLLLIAPIYSVFYCLFAILFCNKYEKGLIQSSIKVLTKRIKRS